AQDWDCQQPGESSKAMAARSPWKASWVAVRSLRSIYLRWETSADRHSWSVVSSVVMRPIRTYKTYRTYDGTTCKSQRQTNALGRSDHSRVGSRFSLR